MIDSHAHIAEEAYDDDRGEILARAAEAGVDAVVVIGYDASSSWRAIEVARSAVAAREPSREAAAGPAASRPVALFATAGVAPHHVLETDEAALESVRTALDEDLVVGVGEIGLDFHYDMPRDAQRALFARQLDWARELDLPVVIHSREAEDDVIALLRRHRPPGGVLHCFTEGSGMAEAAVDMGLYVSFAGIVTFKNAEDLREVAARVPLDRMLIETDSPYLAPVPHRGKRNEPAYVVEVARAIGELHGVSAEEVGRITAANTRELFGLAAPRAGGRLP